jgi:hypothetical protein
LNEKRHSSFDIDLSVYLSSQKSQQEEKIVASNFKYLYWSIA